MPREKRTFSRLGLSGTKKPPASPETGYVASLLHAGSADPVACKVLRWLRRRKKLSGLEEQACRPSYGPVKIPVQWGACLFARLLTSCLTVFTGQIKGVVSAFNRRFPGIPLIKLDTLQQNPYFLRQ